MRDQIQQQATATNRRLAEALARAVMNQHAEQAAAASAAPPRQEVPFENRIFGPPSRWREAGGGPAPVDPRDAVPPSEEMDEYMDNLMRHLDQLEKIRPLQQLPPQKPPSEPPSPRQPIPPQPILPPQPMPPHRPGTRMLADAFSQGGKIDPAMLKALLR
jgi:hypothetical protein